MDKLNIINDNEEKEFDILFTINDEKNNKKYLLYKEPNNNTAIFAALYDENNNKISYINNQKDQEFVAKILEVVKKEIKEERGDQ